VYDWRKAEASVSGVTGNSMARAAWLARRLFSADASSFISPIGVMPAIVSFGNAPMEYPTAPIRRPSM